MTAWLPMPAVFGHGLQQGAGLHQRLRYAAAVGRQAQPALGGRLQCRELARGEKLHGRSGGARWWGGKQLALLQQALGLLGHGFAGVQQVYVRADQALQHGPGKHVVGAAQNQGVHVPRVWAKLA
mgnify:CR=1 FL=1